MNSINFNSQRYEHYLSTFGKKVLANLMKNIVERRNSNIINVRDQYICGQKNRILNFGESYISTVCQQDASHNTIIDNNKPSCGNTRDATFSTIPAVQGMLKTSPEDHQNTEKEIVCTMMKKDAHHPGTDLTVIEKCGNGSDSDNICLVENHIEWDDIFDTQLLSDLNSFSAECSTNSQKDVTDNSNSIRDTAQYKNDFHYGETNTKPAMLTLQMTKCVTSNDLSGKHNTECNVTKKSDIIKGTTKRSNCNKITNVVPMKVKNLSTELPKNLFRKQKYTTVVKTWLTDVQHGTIQNANFQRNKENAAEETSIIAATNKPEGKKDIRKTIQSRLTNKGGVMKFGKPKQNEFYKKSKNLNVITENNVSNESGITVTEKSVKPKFLAPVKSQSPVQNVSYNIIYLTDNNFKEYVTELSVVKTEINMTLMFSNGFCQLESIYTDDACVVAGVMFEINNVIYYWKHNYKMFCSIMEKIIYHNTIVCYDGKRLLKYFVSQPGIDVMTTDVNVLDVQIGGNLIDPNNAPENFSNLQKLLSFVPDHTISSECVQQKCAWYLTVLGKCFVKLRSLLIDYELWKVFVEIEMQVLPIVADMEQCGVRVDTERLRSMESSLMRCMKSTELACHAAAGRAFQVNSALQVRTILYDELRLDVRSNVRVRETLSKGDKSTSESMKIPFVWLHHGAVPFGVSWTRDGTEPNVAVNRFQSPQLRSLMATHPLPKLILQYRHVHKAHATFLAGIAHQVKDGVVTPTWEQMASVTGRIACNNPNLQAIPKTPFSLDLFPGDGTSEDLSTGTGTESNLAGFEYYTPCESYDLSGLTLVEKHSTKDRKLKFDMHLELNETFNFRSVYVPREGYVLLAADFKHIECRVFAYAAADTSLLDALASPDLFRVLAAKWLNKNEVDVSGEDRERTKRIVYASLYGAGTRRLMEILGASYDQTLSIVASFNRTFPSLKSFGRAVVAKCVQQGGRLTTLCGRRRTFPNLFSGDFALKSQAERQAINFVVQGSAADLCKMAMVMTEQRLRGAEPPIRRQLLLQIHDELVWEVELQDVERAAAEIKSTMEGIGKSCGLAVTLPVAISVGCTWGEMETFTPTQQL